MPEVSDNRLPSPEMAVAPMRVLVVDDARDHAQMVVEFLRLSDTCRDALLETADSYEDALYKFEHHSYDLAFLDYWLGARDGLSLLRELRRRAIDTPAVILTGRGAE